MNEIFSMILSKGRKPQREVLLEELAKEDIQILALAYTHAYYLKTFGVDIENGMNTATQHVEALSRAYDKGYYDAMKMCSEREVQQNDQ